MGTSPKVPRHLPVLVGLVSPLLPLFSPNWFVFFSLFPFLFLFCLLTTSLTGARVPYRLQKRVGGPFLFESACVAPPFSSASCLGSSFFSFFFSFLADRFLSITGVLGPPLAGGSPLFLNPRALFLSARRARRCSQLVRFFLFFFLLSFADRFFPHVHPPSRPSDTSPLLRRTQCTSHRPFLTCRRCCVTSSPRLFITCHMVVLTRRPRHPLCRATPFVRSNARHMLVRFVFLFLFFIC